MEREMPTPYATLTPKRIGSWYAEIYRGDERTGSELRLDVLEYVVGKKRLRRYIADLFNRRNAPIATANESAKQRVHRIAGEILNGDRTIASVGKVLDGVT
jgi:hypothetical protein